ncbi:MAG: hypothetical protein ACXWHZ_03565 [Usitatibacter sp.]
MSNRFFSFLTGRLVSNTVAKSSDVNGIFDTVAAGLDNVQGELNRSLKLPVGDAGAEHTFAQDAATRAGKLVQFDGSGNPTASNTLGSDLDAGSHKVTGLPFAITGSSPITLDQLNAFAGALAGLPSLTGQSGKYLSTDGSTVFWLTIPAIPAQSGATNGKFLMSDGTSASWATVPNTVPANTEPGLPLSHDGATFAFRHDGMNLVFNPSGAVNYGGVAAGWTSTTVTMTPTIGARGWQFNTGVLTTQTGQHECASFPFSGSTDLVIAANIDATAQTAGSMSLVMDFRDGSDVSISTASVAITSGVAKRYAATATSPSNCAQVRVRLVFTGVSCSAPIWMNRVKAERGTSATPFNDAATIAWAAGFRALTEIGRGYASPIVRIGDATSTGAKLQLRSTSGAQAHDVEFSVTGGTSGTAGKGDVSISSRSIKNTGAIGFAQEYPAGNSGTAITLDFAANGPKQSVVMTANANITLQNFPVVGQYKIKVTQNGTGNFTPTFIGAAVTWAGGEAPTALAANAVMFVDLYYDGSTCWGSWTPW